MAGIRVNWGIKDLEQQLSKFSQYDAATQDRLRSVVRTSTENIKNAAIRRVRVKTGNLIRHITMTYNEKTNEGVVHVKAPHAHLVEFGHKGGMEYPKRKEALHGGRIAGYAAHVDIPKVAEHPFLRPSFEDEKPNLIKAVEDAINP